MNNFVFNRNIGLIFTRINRQSSTGYFFVSEGIADSAVITQVTDEHVIDNGLDSILVAPLYAYHEDGSSLPNFNSATLSALTMRLKATPSPENVFDYIYAVLHSPSYREKYKEFLKIDFPRILVPASDDEFTRLIKYGNELLQLHLLKSAQIDNYDTTFSIQGNGMVETVRYEDGKVFINAAQYFGNVPEIAWNFYIGGYQPAQKWLKDRKGRLLSNNDVDHYQRIVKILIETDRIMREIG